MEIWMTIQPLKYGQYICLDLHSQWKTPKSAHVVAAKSKIPKKNILMSVSMVVIY